MFRGAIIIESSSMARTLEQLGIGAAAIPACTSELRAHAILHAYLVTGLKVDTEKLAVGCTGAVGHASDLDNVETQLALY